MNHLRQYTQRSTNIRRDQDRRKVDYSFGSTQWLAYVEDNAFAYPKLERRIMVRRKDERRVQALLEQDLARTDTTNQLFSGEELKFIVQVFTNPE